MSAAAIAEAGALIIITDHGPTAPEGGTYYHWWEVTRTPLLLWTQEKRELAYLYGGFSSVNSRSPWGTKMVLLVCKLIPGLPHDKPSPRVRSPTENHEPAQDFQRGSSSPAPYMRADGLEKIGERFLVKEERAASVGTGRPREEV
ncbi:hypothetical protein AVEN_173249-1 [Araneus ventricosus]|uniref:Uncharacterized protein n=1 Tax=Araneus ventricosus TaxID=182803 RepID=A0A4Y2UVQ3_ARAVE|nr:hypothetical protein AVEN_173249-1 [Araneus ventricosus]